MNGHQGRCRFIGRARTAGQHWRRARYWVKAGLFVALATGTAFAHGDWDQLGGNASHSQLATTTGLSSTYTATSHSVVDGSVTDEAQSIVIGPTVSGSAASRDVWGINNGKLYRFDLTVGTGFSQNWSVTLPVSQGPQTGPRQSCIAVDDNQNSYVMTGRVFERYLVSYNSSGSQRWSVQAGDGIGPCLGYPAVSGSPAFRLAWGYQGTEIPIELGHAYVYADDSTELAVFPDPNDLPVSGGVNHPVKLGVSGHPAIGPIYSGGAWLSERVAYYPGQFKRYTTNDGLLTDEYEIWAVDLVNYNWWRVYPATEGTGSHDPLRAIAVDDQSGSTKGYLYVWQYTSSGYQILCIDPSNGSVVWSTLADPAGTNYGQDTEPVAIGSSKIYARKPGYPGTIREIDKTDGTYTDMTTTFTQVGPISIGTNSSGVEYLCFKDGYYLNVRKASDLTALFTAISLGTTGNTGVPIGLAPASSGSARAVLYSWGQTPTGPFGFPETAIRGFYGP